MADEDLKDELRGRSDILLICAILGLPSMQAWHMSIEEHIDWLVKNHKNECIKLINAIAFES